MREGETQRNTQKEAMGRKSQSSRKSDYWDSWTVSRQCGREWAGKAVFIKGIISIGPGVEAFISLCRYLMSWSPSIFWYWRLWGLAGHGKAGHLSERLSDYRPPEGPCYRWMELSSITSSIHPLFFLPISIWLQETSDLTVPDLPSGGI